MLKIIFLKYKKNIILIYLKKANTCPSTYNNNKKNQLGVTTTCVL
jgi:hypothetical protein